MSVEVYKNVNSDKAVKYINRGIAENKHVSILCKCEVNYDGRTARYLKSGDRHIIIKRDGTFLVNHYERMKPLHYQKSTSTIKAEKYDGSTRIEAISSDRNELLEIYCEEIHTIVMKKLEDEHVDEKLKGTEEDMHYKIMKNPLLVEQGFKPLEHEKSVKKGGSIDIYGVDKDESPVVIEAKRRKASQDAVDQLKRYIGIVENEEGSCRGILAAPSITKNAKDRLESNGLEYRQIDPPEDSVDKNDIQNQTLDEYT